MSLTQLLEAMKYNITSLSGMQKFLGGLLVTVFSMSVVFLVLILLMLIIKGMEKVLYKVDKVSTPSEESALALAPQTAQATEAGGGIQEEEVAAVMAAISMMNQRGSHFVVRQIRRTSPAIPAWSQVAMNSCERKR